MLKKIKKTPFNLSVMIITFICMITLSLLSVKFSSIFYILVFGSISVVIYFVCYLKERKNKTEETEK